MALLLDIDPHGRVAPQSDEARRALADRAGRFVLLPCAPDLLVARRTPAAGGLSPARPRCILAGDLSSFPIADFVAFVHHSRLSGVLAVAATGTERSIAFKDGEVRRAQSSVAGERLGDVVVRLGFASEQQVAQAVQSGKAMGRALVDAGVLGANELWKCFHEQVTCVFHSILLSREGTFQLMDDDVLDRPATPLAVNTESLLMDGIRRIDEMSLFAARIPGPRAYVRAKKPRRAVTLVPSELALLALVDGKSTVAEIATRAHLSEFDATKLLFHLAETGYVEAVANPVLGSEPLAHLHALMTGMTELFRTVTAAVPAPKRTTFLSGVRTFLADTAHPLAPVWARAAHADDGTLDEETVLGNIAAMKPGTISRLEPSGDPARLLLAGLQELLFFQLFVAGELLPAEVDEALSAVVRPKLETLSSLARGA